MTGTTSEQTVTEHFRSNNMSFDLVVFEKEDEAVAAYDGGRCDTVTFDKSTLAECLAPHSSRDWPHDQKCLSTFPKRVQDARSDDTAGVSVVMTSVHPS